MNQNTSAFLIGVLGAIVTLSAYSQSYVSPTQCITAGLLILGSGLLVSEVVFWVIWCVTESKFRSKLTEYK